MKRSGYRTEFYLLAILIILVSMAMRIYSPTADLPADITFSGSIYTDEGNQCHNSRSRYLFGDWFPDDWRITNYNPILPYLKLGLFELFGVGIIQIRLVSYLFALLTLILFFFTLKSLVSGRLVLLGTFLLGINFLVIMYNKIGTFETPMIFWMVLSLFFIEKYRSTNWSGYLFLAGTGAYMAVIFKNIALYFLPVPIIAVFFHFFFSPGTTRKEAIDGVKKMVTVAAGSLAVFAVWFVVFYLPNREWIQQAPGSYMGKLMFPASFQVAWQNFLSFPWADRFHKIPIVWLFGLCFIPLFIRRFLSRKSTITETAYVLFLSIHTVVFFFMSYRPTRYFIPTIPVLVFLTILLLQSSWEYLKHGKLFPQPSGKGLLFMADTMWLALFSYFCFIPLYRIFIGKIIRPGFSITYFLIAMVIVFLGIFLRRIAAKLTFFKVPVHILIFPVLMVAVVFSIVNHILLYRQWDQFKTHTVRDISHGLGNDLQNAYIAGLAAPVAVLENRHRALFLYPKFVNFESPFKSYLLTHALLGSGASQEIRNFFRRWPDRMADASLREVYNFHQYFLHLYDFGTPYITECWRDKNQGYRLILNNPAPHSFPARIGYLRISKPEKPTGMEIESFLIGKESKKILLSGSRSGQIIEIDYPDKTDEDEVLFFINWEKRSFRFRYEAEILFHQTGEKQRVPAASNQGLLRFDKRKHKPGYLSFGPFIPYSQGLIAVDFHLRFSDIRARIKPLAVIDIFSREERKLLACASITPHQISKQSHNLYRVTALLPTTKTLEFRLKTNKWSNIEFDYIDVHYYQGYLYREVQ